MQHFAFFSLDGLSLTGHVPANPLPPDFCRQPIYLLIYDASSGFSHLDVAPVLTATFRTDDRRRKNNRLVSKVTILPA